MKYIIENRSGNPAILVRQRNGTYTSIAHGHGEASLGELIALANLANSSPDSDDNTHK